MPATRSSATSMTSPPWNRTPGRAPEDVTEAELLDAAYDLIADLLAQLRATTDSDAPLPGTL